MKKTLLTLFSLLFILTAKAQSDTSNGIAADTLVFTSVQQQPLFPGGINKFYVYLEKYIRYPAIARENHIQGKVVIQMIIEKDGSLSNIKAIQSPSPELDQEAIRVIASSPKWKPGMENGRNVRVMYSVPMTFELIDAHSMRIVVGQ
jgi:protein TonB